MENKRSQPLALVHTDAGSDVFQNAWNRMTSEKTVSVEAVHIYVVRIRCGLIWDPL